MTANRSAGGHSDFADNAEPTSVDLRELDASVKVEVCRLLTALMGATIKQLNSSALEPDEIRDCDVEIVEVVVSLARQYKYHLSFDDALTVAIVTSEDLARLRSVMNAVPDSRRLDSVLFKANQILAHDDLTFTRSSQDVWLGRRNNKDSPFYLSARVMQYPYFDATPPNR